MKEEQGSTLREAQMICTVTLNPALDYTLDVKDFRPGRTNRTLREEILPGGKGINVSLVLRNLGFESRVLGFTAGFTGGELERLLRERGLKTDFIRLSSGMTRINVKLRSMEGTELNARGPEIGPESLELFLERMCWSLQAAFQRAFPAAFMRTSWGGFREKASGSWWMRRGRP